MDALRVLAQEVPRRTHEAPHGRIADAVASDRFKTFSPAREIWFCVKGVHASLETVFSAFWAQVVSAEHGKTHNFVNENALAFFFPKA